MIWIPSHVTLMLMTSATTTIRCGHGVSRLVQSVAPRFPNLQCCKLRRCCALDDTAIEAAARNWHGLKTLDLTFGTQLTDACLRALAEGCPLLEKLDLSGCTGITQAGLVILAQHCNNLRHLNLCGCDSGGTDTALQVHKPFLCRMYGCDLMLFKLYLSAKHHKIYRYSFAGNALFILRNLFFNIWYGLTRLQL